MSKILIVEDEPELLELLVLMIQGELEEEILLAKNGSEALQIMAKEEHITLILSDWNMKGGGGELILNELQQRRDIPFILMSGALELHRELATKTKNLKFFKVLSKPFGHDQLMNAIQLALAAELSDFCRLGLDSLMLEPSLSYALYLKLGERKFVKIAREGEQTLSDVLSHYRQKKISSFYMKRPDFESWLQELFAPHRDSLKKTLQLNPRSLSHLSEMGRRFYSRFHLSLQNFGIEEGHYEQVVLVLEEVTSELHERPDLSELLGLILAGESYLSDHSFFIIFLASYLAKDLGLSGKETIKKIVYAAFFHDLALASSESALCESAPEKVSDLEERAHIHAHPQRIISLLGKHPQFSRDVIHIILEHHELPDGSGYPCQLTASEIHPLSCLFILCHLASELFLIDSMRPEEVADAFCSEMGERYNCGNFKRPLQVMRSHFFK